MDRDVSLDPLYERYTPSITFTSSAHIVTSFTHNVTHGFIVSIELFHQKLITLHTHLLSIKYVYIICLYLGLQSCIDCATVCTYPIEG